jgi:hypothetical protein
MVPGENNRPTFTSLYFDTNVLLANRWPEPAPILHNVLTLAGWWNIDRCVPEPVLHEAAFHWQRKVREAADAFASARNAFTKAATPLIPKVTVDHTTVTELQRQFRNTTEATVAASAISIISYTSTSLQQIFSLAAQYVRPFADKGEGKGFKDVVILLSIIEHLQRNPGKQGVLITNDGDFRNVDYARLAPAFDEQRLRISDLDSIWRELFEPHFDETRVKPYRQLLITLDTTVRHDVDHLQAFIASGLTADMLRPGIAETAQQMISIERVDVRSVDFPFPEAPLPSVGSIEFTIKVIVTCRAVVAVNLTLLRGLFGRTDTIPEPARIEEKAVPWFGSVDALVTEVAGELKRIDYVRLLGE